MFRYIHVVASLLFLDIFFPSVLWKLKSFLHISAIFNFVFQNYENNTGIHVPYKNFKIGKYRKQVSHPASSHTVHRTPSSGTITFLSQFMIFLFSLCICAYICIHTLYIIIFYLFFCVFLLCLNTSRKTLHECRLKKKFKENFDSIYNTIFNFINKF